VAAEVDARLNHGDAFAFKEFSLQRGVGFANEEFSARAENAMPGNAFARRRRGHRTPSSSRSARKAQGFSEGSIG
jgi:hypothetical protein